VARVLLWTVVGNPGRGGGRDEWNVPRGSIKVGDRVRVKEGGGSAAAAKYAGEEGQVTLIGAGLYNDAVDVRIEGNAYDTVFIEEDLTRTTQPLR
jgi:hypothetical protein